MNTPSEMRWLDFSGAPPMLIPRHLAAMWRGTTDPQTGEYRELDTNKPVTDYDRACAVAWPGKSVVVFENAQVLVFYTEYDDHTWDSTLGLVACGGWLPPHDELQRATWTDRLEWRCQEKDLLLMNSAADGTRGLREGDSMPVQLEPGIYSVDFAVIESEYAGCFHRIVRQP